MPAEPRPSTEPVSEDARRFTGATVFEALNRAAESFEVGGLAELLENEGEEAVCGRLVSIGGRDHQQGRVIGLLS